MFFGVGLGVTARSGAAGPPAPPAKTYAQFQQHIQGLATDGSVGGSSTLQTPNAAAFRITGPIIGGGMSGSPWNALVRGGGSGSGVYRVLQHALPSLEIMQAIVAGGFETFMRTEAGPASTTVNALDRNGYVSGSFAGAATTFRVIDLIRWDDVLKKAFRSNPSVGGAEAEYVF